MNTFLLDLWHDLREKRLWPVAAVLALALVAVPLVLAKPAEEPAAPVVEDAAAEKPDRAELAALAEVKLGEDQSARGSTLGLFDPANPFAPPKGAIKKEADSAGSTGPGSGSTAADAGDTRAGGGDAPSSGGTTGGGGDPGVPGGGDPGGDGGGTQTAEYEYVVDVTFTANGRTRRISGLRKLEMLPNESSPLLIFMGVTAKGSNAVFLVDSTLAAAGEGRCKPSGEECAFAYIGPGSEHMFSEDDGDTYRIRIDEIRKVKLDSAHSAKADGAKARASVGEPRRFVLPLMADLVVTASDELEDSKNETESR